MTVLTPKTHLNSIGQIMLQNSPVTGGLFLLAVLIESPKMAMMMLFAVLVANICAWVCKPKTEHLTQGLYGFSAALVGLFVAVFFKVGLASFVLTFFGAMLAMGLQALGLRWRLPLYTLPFIVASWGVYLLGVWLDVPTNDVGMALADIHFIKGDFIQGVLKSTGQVMFLGSALAGGLCLLGIFVNDFCQHQGKYAIFAVSAATLAYGLGMAMGADSQELAMGLWGYNSVLTIIALADKKPWAWLLGIIITVAIQWGFTAFINFSLMGGFLTLPFVLAVWVILAIEQTLTKTLDKQI